MTKLSEHSKPRSCDCTAAAVPKNWRRGGDGRSDTDEAHSHAKCINSRLRRPPSLAPQTDTIVLLPPPAHLTASLNLQSLKAARCFDSVGHVRIPRSESLRRRQRGPPSRQFANGQVRSLPRILRKGHQVQKLWSPKLRSRLFLCFVWMIREYTGVAGFLYAGLEFYLMTLVPRLEFL